VTKDELLRLIDEAAAEIGKLTKLKTLVLGRWDKKKRKQLGNNLKTLPDEIGQLTELRSPLR